MAHKRWQRTLKVVSFCGLRARQHDSTLLTAPPVLQETVDNVCPCSTRLQARHAMQILDGKVQGCRSEVSGCAPSSCAVRDLTSAMRCRCLQTPTLLRAQRHVASSHRRTRQRTWLHQQAQMATFFDQWVA